MNELIVSVCAVRVTEAVAIALCANTLNPLKEARTTLTQSIGR